MSETTGSGLDVPREQHWVCEVNAPIPWHDEVRSQGCLRLADGRPTAAELARAWATIENAGAVPCVCVNLGPDPDPDSDTWIVEVDNVSATGGDAQMMAEVAEILGGRLALQLHNPIEWLVWATKSR